MYFTACVCVFCGAARAVTDGGAAGGVGADLGFGCVKCDHFSPGFYCPEGSTRADAILCPAGRWVSMILFNFTRS